MTAEILPVTPARWDAFEALFGVRGACEDCWCTSFRMPKEQRRQASGDQRREVMRMVVSKGPPPGLLAMQGDRALGWMQIGPRFAIPVWNGERRASAPVEPGDALDPGVWAISCFFLDKTARGEGLSHRLVEAGIDHARSNGARQVEACPRDRGTDPRRADLFVGVTKVFERAGFERVIERRSGRPLMRFVL